MTWLYVPNTSTSAHSAPADTDWTSPLNWRFRVLAPSLWWRGNPLPPHGWSRLCKRASSLRPLFGAMPEPSEAARGVERLTASLAASRVSRTASPESDSVPKTSATCGVPSGAPLSNPARGSCGLKTSPACSRAPKVGATPEPSGYDETYTAWVSRLREASLQRRRLARRTLGSGSSDSGFTTDDSARWPTPVAQDDNKSPEAHLAMKARMGERDGSNANRTAITSLNVMAKAWPTPAASEVRQGYQRRPEGMASQQNQQSLTTVAVDAAWQTPAVSCATGGQANRGQDRQDELLLAGQAREISSRLDPETSPDGGGGSEPALQLNPRFVEALMGWPTGWTACECSATELSRWLADMRSALWSLSLHRPPPAQPSFFD